MRYVYISLVLVAVLVLIWISTAAKDDGTPEGRGETLLASNCARCHAIGRAGSSPHAQAPPFRALGQRYDIDNLAEALAEGLSTGHPDMPEFVFGVADVSAILAYLHSIQAPGTERTRNRSTK
jgi:cytochrome c